MSLLKTINKLRKHILVSEFRDVFIESFQRVVNSSEARTSGGLVRPALFHQFVDGSRSVVGTRKHIPCLYKFYDLLMGHSIVGLQSKGENLPQTDCKRPHIRLDRVFIVQDAFQRHPADWDCVMFISFVIILHANN